jgi:hypothetical protein
MGRLVFGNLHEIPRQVRIDATGAIHLIIARGIEQKPIFKGDVDREDFLHRLGTILTETDTTCFA